MVNKLPNKSINTEYELNNEVKWTSVLIPV